MSPPIPAPLPSSTHQHNYSQLHHQPLRRIICQLSQCSTSSSMTSLSSSPPVSNQHHHQQQQKQNTTPIVSVPNTPLSPHHHHYFSYDNCPIVIDDSNEFAIDNKRSPPPLMYTPPPLSPEATFGMTTASKSATTYNYGDTNEEETIHGNHKCITVNYYKFIFKLGIVLISFAGFLYQATDICHHYFSYRTVVYTNTEQDSLVDLPSITFCLPTYFTKRTIEDLYAPYIKRNVDETAAFKNRSMLDAIKPVIYETFQVGSFLVMKENMRERENMSSMVLFIKFFLSYDVGYLCDYKV